MMMQDFPVFLTTFRRFEKSSLAKCSNLSKWNCCVYVNGWILSQLLKVFSILYFVFVFVFIVKKPLFFSSLLLSSLLSFSRARSISLCASKTTRQCEIQFPPPPQVPFTRSPSSSITKWIQLCGK